MSKHYYSAKTVLELAIGHHFYRKQHYVYLSPRVYPFKTNPKSSNPLLIYQDIYHPWTDQDEHDKYISQLRLNIRKGVLAKHQEKMIEDEVYKRLTHTCDSAPLQLFYPVIVRVKAADVPAPRRRVAGSGLKGAQEVLVQDLHSDELELLFFDEYIDKQDVLDIIGLHPNSTYKDSHQILDLIERLR